MFPVFSSLQQLDYPRKISKSVLVIRGTKDRPPQGSLRRVVTPVQKRASLTIIIIIIIIIIITIMFQTANPNWES